MSDRSKSLPEWWTENGWKQLAAVAGAGAFGGFVSWVYSMWSHLELPFPIYCAIPASLALGATAAVFGIYLVSNTDRSDMLRMIVLGALFGIVWKPTIDASSALVNRARQARAERRVSELVALAERDLKAIKASYGGQATVKVSAAKLAVQNALFGLNDVNNRTVYLNSLSRLDTYVSDAALGLDEKSAADLRETYSEYYTEGLLDFSARHK